MARTARWGATRFLRGLHHAGCRADAAGAPLDEFVGGGRQPPLSRRQFLGALGATGVALGWGAAGRAPTARARTAPRVGIVGGGAAGLACAHRLHRFGIPSVVYEADTRLGGRIRTSHGFFGGGAVVEQGGEFISSEHRHTRRLAASLGLELEVVSGGAFVDGGEEVYFVDGAYYTAAEAQQDWADAKAWQIFKSAVQAAPYPPTFDDFNPEHERLDRLPLPDWLDEVGIGSRSRLGRLLQTDAVVEYGPAAAEQTCLNLIYIIGWNGPSVQPLAGTDEAFHVVGGNEALTAGLAAALPAGSVETGRALAAVDGAALGPYTLSFDAGPPAVVDVLVLALPFTTLRDVELSPAITAGFRPAKRRAIAEMVLGPNAKVHVQTRGRPWAGPLPTGGTAPVVGNGVSYSDPDDFICCWDATVADTATSTPVLVNYLGGPPGASLRQREPFGPAHHRDVSRFLDQIERVFPGTREAAFGPALGSSWTDHPWSKGAYFSPTLGQYTRFFGAPGLPEGNILFCGEHTELDAFGFIEGAVRTGELVAQRVHTSS